jgi:hypothetical protein
MAEAVKTVAKRSRRKTRRQFCSRLAAQAFAAAGINLVADPDYCTPQELRESHLLAEVPDVMIEASAEQAKAWEERANIPQLMIDTTNAVLRSARRISSDIENLNDIDFHLVAHPQHDAAMRQAYEESGYLTLFRIGKNPWHYDFDLMKELGNRSGATEYVEWYCRVTIDGAADGRRFRANRQHYQKLSNEMGLTTFHCLAELYGRLSVLHEARVETARRWLREEAGVDDAEPVAPPNSASWLASVEKLDFQKAAHTREVVRLAKSEAVCSICGDEPAADYVLEGGAEGIVLRLCEDCVTIRGEAGEAFLPVGD